MLIEIVVSVILIIPFLTAIVAFYFWLFNFGRNQAVKRHNDLYRFVPDENGNYPTYHNFEDGRTYEPRTGNPRYALPPDQIIVLNDGRVRKITASAAPTRPDNLLPLYENGKLIKMVAEEITPAEEIRELPTPETTFEPPKSDLDKTIEAYRGGHTSPAANGHACGWKESKARGLIKLAKEQGLIQ
jgi:hypothetical protein